MNVSIEDWYEESININGKIINLEQFDYCCGVAIINIPNGLIVKDEIDKFFKDYDQASFEECEDRDDQDSLFNAPLVIITLGKDTILKYKEYIYEY